MSSDELALDPLPDLPQVPRLRRHAAEIWADPAVAALWLGGSLARGAGDKFSDIDLRVAVREGALLPAGAAGVIAAAVVHLAFPFGEDATLHHLLLEDGAIWDLFVQRADREPSPEARLVLGCRDAALAAKLAGGADLAAPAFPPADPVAIRQTIASFWIGQQKHLKVLHRELPVLAWQGENLMLLDLVRLWFVDATGNDCGPLGRGTIHTLTPVIRAVQTHCGDSALALLGAPRRTVGELLAAARQTQNEVATVGRRLASRLDFTYPGAAETLVRRAWTAFVP